MRPGRPAQITVKMSEPAELMRQLSETVTKLNMFCKQA